MEEENQASAQSTVEGATMQASSATTSGSISTYGFSVEDIEEKRDDGDLAIAVIMVSTKLESVLALGIKQELDLDSETFDKILGNNGLGHYAQLCSKLNVFDDSYDQSVIDKYFSGDSVRNRLVHAEGYLKNLEENEDEQEKAKEAIEKAIDLIEDIT